MRHGTRGTTRSPTSRSSSTACEGTTTVTKSLPTEVATPVHVRGGGAGACACAAADPHDFQSCASRARAPPWARSPAPRAGLALYTLTRTTQRAKLRTARNTASPGGGGGVPLLAPPVSAPACRDDHHEDEDEDDTCSSDRRCSGTKRAWLWRLAHAPRRM